MNTFLWVVVGIVAMLIGAAVVIVRFLNNPNNYR